MQGMNTAAQLSINLRMTADARAFELRAGSAVADLQSGAGFQRDKFVEATALSSLRRHLLAGAGLGLHSFASNIRGVGSQATRPALNALVGARLPLAPDGSALLELAARGALMRSAHEFSLVLSMQLAPQRGGLWLGERTHVQQQFIEANGSWDNIVEEVMLQEETLPQLLDVIATGSTLVMKFADGPNVALAVSRVARVLNGSSDRIELAIHAPDPLMVAAAATAGFA